jgi:hypothetical protein
MGDEEEARSVGARATALLEERAARLPGVVRELFWALPGRQALRPDDGATDRGVVSGP